jgi:hypothetical protein
MKKSLLVGFALIALNLDLPAQISNNWTRNGLIRIYGGRVAIGYVHSRITSVTFIKPAPASFHREECLSLILMVLRGPGVPMLRPDSGDIQFIDRGKTTIWRDRVSGYSVDDAGGGLQFTARRNGTVRLTAKVIRARDESDFVLTEA